ncbi:MAG: TonB-dependent receptor plug domain-containing protein [Bacteroidetes bacterium]|nr:TonB-dependent receptor plug domain-containing protein [Bacteroidota bacterium]
MKRLFLYYILPAVLFCSYLSSGAQALSYADTKEKIYVQTSHVFFKPGETMYFKCYVVNAKDQTPSLLSRVLYADIINPSGNTIQRLNYRVEDGYAEGSFSFDASAPGGLYKIKTYTNWMRNEKDSSFFVKQVTVQKVISPRLLMKLDFPEKGYGPGSEVRAAFSLRNLGDQPVRGYTLDYKVSLAGKEVHTGKFTTDNEGKADIRFTLPADLATTDGLLNVSVQYEANTESISRSIPIALNKIDLQFLPEGGRLVAGLAGRLAFRAVNKHGRPVDVKGIIKNSQGSTIAPFESYKFGMGSLPFTPQPGETYTAVITAPSGTGQVFTLPAADARGVALQVQQQDGHMTVSLGATDPIAVRLVGESRNSSCYSQNLTLEKGNNQINIDAGSFPAGIAKFTLYTASGMPLAERLVFMHRDQQLQVTITPDKTKYNPRGKVRLSIHTADESGRPVASNLSIAVVDDKLWSFADDKQDNIVSWLLMSSELRGHIEEPAFYFKKEEPKSAGALDLVMLTHGYRYFDYVEDAQKNGVMKYAAESSNMMAGMITDARNQPISADVFLISPVPGERAARFRTDKTGLFYFTELAPNSNYYVLAGAQDKREYINIRMLSMGDGMNPSRISDLAKLFPEPTVNGAPGAAPLAMQRNNPGDLIKQMPGVQVDRDGKLGLFDGNARLDEVVVIGYGAAAKRDMTGSVVTIRAEELPRNNMLMALEGKIPGVTIAQPGNPLQTPSIAIRGVGTFNDTRQPLIVVDGVPMESFNVNNLNPNEINSITVLKDAAATAIYGSRGAYGIIVIETNRRSTEKIRFNISPRYYYTSQFIRSGGPAYSVSRRFYAPLYSHESREKTDFRETIYWNGVVQTDKDGNAEVTYYNSDATTTFRAIAEGLGCNGRAGRAEQTYSVKTEMAVDAKIPPYLTVGDKALIPLVIKNNRSEALEINIGLKLPENLQAGSFGKKFQLMPDSARAVYIPLEAMAAVKGNIEFVVQSNYNTETLVLPVEASDKGFPVTQTISGNKPGQHHFDIGQTVPGSLKAKLQLYRHLEGQLLDNIESMLQEPYGCFEQTSSTTYPNVYILKYLKSSGRSNPAVEQKALTYIQNGYKRLIGFETSENGFEWFGHSPAHEALTAYGLLEFTDMRGIVDVDAAMLERTKKFLLGRRDGRGSFRIASGGYDRFASVPNRIAQIYIVYAMTEAGMGREIQREYDSAFQKALRSGDAYQMSMMALAASNMLNTADYQTMMNALQRYGDAGRLPSETSVVNSSGQSLRVETMALYAMALMRSSQPNLGQVADILSRILAEKSYYGYGSTQATVLALHAIVAYAMLQNRAPEQAGVRFSLNGSAVHEEAPLLGALQNGINLFAINYDDNGSHIPYNFEVSYHTLTPPNDGLAPLTMETRLTNVRPATGETVRMEVAVTNTKAALQPMTIAKVGIPAGLSVQPWQLKELMEKNQVAYYEIFDNYLVLYWMGFAEKETKTIYLDLKAEIPGTYKGKAGCVYLYYTPEHRHWSEGAEAEILVK